MPSGWICALAAPALALPLLMVTLGPTTQVAAPLRLAAVRAALTVGVFAVTLVEVAGALGALNAPVLGGGWAGFLLVCTTLTVRRWRRDSTGPRRLATLLTRHRLPHSRGERLLLGTLGVLVLAELLIAVLAEPNNFDSQTYHLPKVEHWVSQESLNFWPTAIHRQVTIPPGAEYLLLHLRLLSGGDALHNLLQFAAGLGCLLVVARITAQLGGGRRAQLMSAFVFGTTPMVVLQATSTQTDLVTAAWTGCVATLVLDELRRRSPVGSVLALGAATGLTAVTKTSGLLGVGPLLLLWGLAQLRLGWRAGGARRGFDVLRVAAGSVGVLLVAAVVVGPFLLRVANDFGNPFGPPRLRESIPLQRHDVPSIVVNGLRIAHTALDTPLAPLRDASAAAIIGFARSIGVDPQDRASTFGSTRFPVPAWYPDEDRVAFPIAGTLALIALTVALIRPARLTNPQPPTGRRQATDRLTGAPETPPQKTPPQDGVLRAYAVATTGAILLYPAVIKWQPWGNRLLLYTLVLATPLVGIWLDTVLRRRPAAAAEPGAEPGRRPLAPVLIAAALTVAALAGVLSVSYGFPRRLVGAGSTLTTDDWQTRFLRRPQWAPEFRWAAGQVTRSGARRIGLVQQNDNWEYPWWVLLEDREIVALQSVLPQRPPAHPTSVDAILCTGDRAACRRLVPAGWTLTWQSYVGYAAPPGR